MTSDWFVWIGLFLVVIIAVALLARKSVRAELTVQADPEQVWSVLTDPGSYEDWNPILISVDGEFAEGQTLSGAMKSPDGSVTMVAPKIKKLVPNVVLSQVGGVPGILTFDHSWKLEPVNGGTRVTQFEGYRGIGVLFWDPAWVGKACRQAILNLRNLVDVQ